MKIAWKVAIVVALVVGVGAVLALKQRAGRSSAAPSPNGASAADQRPAQQAALPRLVDLGAATCIPCKMMAPVLESLSKEYQSRLEVVVIDVRDDPLASTIYRVSVIPTQIFYDAAGKELFRHEGFMAKDDILAKWKELGVDLGPPSGK